MNEPPRLHTEPESELERSLLDAGRSYTASASSRAKALAALGVVGITASSTTAASALTKATVLKWLGATALLVGAAVPAVRYLARQSAAPALSATTRATSTTPPLAEHPPGAPESPVAVGTEPTPSPPESTPAEPAPNGVPNLRAEPKAAAAPALSAELSALDSARAALAAKNPSAALSDLDAYAHNFPHGRLSLEAEVLRIDALAKSGQTAAAKKRAQAFIKRHPDSVLASRVRAYAEQ